MPASRAPWWMYVAAVSFLAFFSFTIYSDFVGPAAPGIDRVDDRHGHLEIVEIAPGLRLDRAGLLVGDRIIAIDDQPIHTWENYRRARMRFRADRPIDLEVERGGRRFHLSVLLGQRPFLRLGFNPPSVEYVTWRGAMLSWIIISFVVFLRPDDLSARLGALVFATLPAAVTMWAAQNEGYGGWVSAWRSLPWPLAALLAIPAVCSVVLPITQFLFYSTFPRSQSSLLPRLLPWCVPGLLLIPAVFHIFWPIYEPVALLRRWEQPALMLWLGVACMYNAAGLWILAANYRHAFDQNERRRVRAIMPAISLALGLLLASGARRVAAELFGTPLPSQSARLAVTAPFGVMFLLYPLPIVYAILRHRVFDISFVVRRGIRYLFARRFLISLLPALGLLLLFDVASRSEQTIAAVVVQRGWMYAAVGAVALVARQHRGPWLDALDRRFFRERYNAEHLLRETAEEIRAASALEQVAPRALARIESSLHPEFAALLVRDPGETAYQTIASAPAGLAPLTVAADSKILGVLRLLGKPLQVFASDSGWLRQQLPHADTEFLRQSRIDLLVPIAMSASGREALLVLGQKKSEEPYGSEDQGLLVAIANGLALLLERPVTTVSSAGLEECPQCGSCYNSGFGRCREDGTALTPSPIPRVLVGRYRLDRRLGRGGMGTVYSAWDTSLERQVALKLIRDDLIASAEAAERFRREAKAAAAIAHPNLVTLYDFAVDSGRAFLVMEQLAGLTLRQRLRQQGRMTPEALMIMVRGLCSALSVAHQRGLVHRDLKPDNIVLTQESGGTMPKILDFGLAKFVSSRDADSTATSLSTSAGIVVGTPRYMSPEQLTGKPVSPAWDLWAVAVITYEALTAEYPFGNCDSVAALQLAILSGRYEPIQEHLPDAPARWHEFFTDVLAVGAERRPASAVEFLSRCERAFE